MGYAAGTGFEIQERFVWIADNENSGLDDSLSLVISQLVPSFLNDKKVNKCKKKSPFVYSHFSYSMIKCRCNVSINVRFLESGH